MNRKGKEKDQGLRRELEGLRLGKGIERLGLLVGFSFLVSKK